jgi:iron complex outermembrane recepter protein
VFDPVYELDQRPETFPLPDFGSASKERNRSLGLFVQDRVAISDQLRLVGGLRWSQFRQRTLTSFPSGESVEDRQKQTAWTSQLGVLYNPAPDISLFANRTTSFLPVSGITSEGRPLDPETGVQYELGAKASVGRTLSLTASLFHLKRGDVAVSDRDDPSALIAIGEQVAKGFELSATARPAAGLELYAGYAFTRAKTTEDTNADLIGKRIRNVPRHSFSGRATYELQSGLARGLRLGALATFTGDRAGDLEDSFELPGYWRFDAHADYPITDRISIGASVENLADKRYYTHSYSLFEVWPGAPRTWKLDLTARF